MKFAKTLVAAALLAGATGAQASQLASNSAFLAVYDATHGTTYDLNLDAVSGLNFTTLATSGSLSIDLSTDAVWNTFRSTLDTANALWGVAASTLGKFDVTTASAAPQTFLTSGAKSLASGSISTDATRINLSLVGNSVVVADAAADQGGWANAAGSSATFDNLWGTAGSMHAAIAYGATGNFITETAIKSFSTLGTWNLSGSTLTFTSAAVTAVPLPAAVWMFGAGLMGFLGLNRRKSAAV